MPARRAAEQQAVEFLVEPDHARCACRLDLLEASCRTGIRSHQVEGEPPTRQLAQADLLQIRDQDGVSQGLRELLSQLRQGQLDRRRSGTHTDFRLSR